ncbi:MAG: DNA cytosine methyltransferase [Clostridia bacterium]|nr:DNA cytosine methyltransferase [Clostridia bacterium]
MKVLVACEESQRVTLAFRKLNHEAYSCDIKDCSGGFPEYHIKSDCRAVAEWGNWDLIIAHPPCQCLCRLDSANYVKFGAEWALERAKKREEAREFFMFFYNLDGRVCIENPIPSKKANLPQWSQIIQPYDFGENFSKKTCLWLKGLPYLIPNCIVQDRRNYGAEWCKVTKHSVQRAKTFPAVARAMAEQWGGKNI